MARSRFTLCGTAILAILGQSAAAFAADCFIDSQNGDDTKDGSSEANAVKTQAKIPSSCTTVKYKRGSQFNEAVKISNSAKSYTNYGDANDPLPKFVVSHTVNNSGSLVSAFQGGITIDGLYLAGSKGDGTMNNLIKGVCVMLGGTSKLLNSEITNCDIGIMLMGTGSLVQGNYVHDLTMAVDAAQSSGTYINAVGGAEGIFINGSNNEIAYNTFVNCSSAAEWTGGSCDGGATEVTVGAGATLSGVKVHHNFSYNSCGFFEVSGKGNFTDSQFYYNVSVDSGWLMLLQVNETTMSNIRWDNNTVVQHKGTSNAGMVTTIYGGTGTSGGATTGVTLPTGQVSMTNNLIILDGVTAFGSTIDTNIAQTTNLVATSDPGVKNIKGTSAADFDLASGSAAIDKGTAVSGMTLDYLNRAVPNGVTDIGAFEYGATAAATAGGTQGFGGAAATTGGAAATTAGGAAATTAGGAATATGGKAATTAGGAATATGGSSSTTTGGAAQGSGGGSTTPTVGGSQNTGGGATTASSTGGANGTAQPASGGSTNTTTTSTNPGVGGSNDVPAGGATATTGGLPVGDEGGCACRVAHCNNHHAVGLGLLGLALLGLRRRRGACH